MKIAFVGKGGSGKSTVSSLFIHYLLSQNKRVLALDADLNVHLRKLLHVDPNYQISLSDPEVTEQIQQYIIGKNSRITDYRHIISTTPPGTGSQLITLDTDDQLLRKIAYNDGNLSFLQVGLPSRYDMGIRCYHVNLETAEMLLSHMNEARDEYVVADMVAGVDAFATSMYVHFDVLLIVVEPTEQSVSVLHDYKKLADEAGIDVSQKIKIVGNKIEDEHDQKFLEDTGFDVIGYLPYTREIKISLREGQSLSIDRLPQWQKSFAHLLNKLTQEVSIDKMAKLKRIHRLHEIISQKPHNIAAHGDLRNQIDEEFVYPEAA